MAEFATDPGLGFVVPVEMGVGDGGYLLALGEIVAIGVFIAEEIYHHSSTTGEGGITQG